MYIGQWHLSPLQNRHLGTSHSSPNCHQLPCHIFVNLIDVWNLFPFKGDFSFGKSQSHRAPNLGCRGAESPGWFDVLPKHSAWDVMHEQAHCHDEAANHQLPVAAGFWIIPIDSLEEFSSLMQNLMQIPCSTCWVILNEMATQYTCSLNGVYHPTTALYSEVVIVHTCAL